MYVPRLEQRRNGLPVISKRQISRLGNQIISDYCSDILQNPKALDEEDFSHYYLRTEMDFQFLSHCGIYLGMTVFQDSVHIPVFIPERMQAEYIAEKAGTIIIDKSLLEQGQAHRYRYTIFHESAHWLIHQNYYRIKYQQECLTQPSAGTFSLCRKLKNPYASKPNKQWRDEDWAEWQANALASAMLMPESATLNLLCHMGSAKTAFDLAGQILQVSRIFNVSLTAAKYRLQDLGFYKGFSPYAVDAELSIYAY